MAQRIRMDLEVLAVTSRRNLERSEPMTRPNALLPALGVMISTSALAGPPPVPEACSASNELQKAYRSGFAYGANLVQRAWLRIQNCAQYEHFAQNVRRNADRYQERTSSPYIYCRHTGALAGVEQALLVIDKGCSRSSRKTQESDKTLAVAR